MATVAIPQVHCTTINVLHFPRGSYKLPPPVIYHPSKETVLVMDPAHPTEIPKDSVLLGLQGPLMTWLSPVCRLTTKPWRRLR